MKMTELRQKAETLGIRPAKMKKVELVRTIQKTEDYTPCFGTSGGQCEHSDCCFLADCLKIKD